MIPQILHFIWIGDKPKYVSFAIEAYKKVNPNCNINLASFSVKHFEEIYFDKHIYNENEQIAYDALNDIFNGEKYQDILKIFMNGYQHINYSNTPFQQIFVDIYRLALLNRYGGLYVDCDTYPIKPFDNLIFDNQRICVVDKVKDNVYALNNYFIGAVAGSNWTNCFDNSYVKIVQENNQQFILTNKVKTTDFTIRRIKFFKCKLTSDDFKNIKTSDYFEHYSEFRWGNNKVPITKFDKIFDRKKYID